MYQISVQCPGCGNPVTKGDVVDTGYGNWNTVGICEECGEFPIVGLNQMELDAHHLFRDQVHEIMETKGGSFTEACEEALKHLKKLHGKEE